MKRNWPTLTCENVPWASHTPRCNLHGWSSLAFACHNNTSLPVTDMGQGERPASFDEDSKSALSKEEMETTTEDGELPSLLPVASGVNNVKLTPSKGNEVEYSRKRSFISNSIISPISKGKSPNFKKYKEDTDLMVESENELDEPIQVEEVSDDASPLGGLGMVKNSWADCGVQEYSLVLMRKLDNGSENMKLEAKVKSTVHLLSFVFSTEFIAVLLYFILFSDKDKCRVPVRPPHFEISVHNSSQGENYSKGNDSKWSNELRAMEAEVNVHIIKMIPFNQENSVLAHQVLYLAMMFDFFLDDEHTSPEKSTCTSVIDVGLCKPVIGGLISLSIRGRDHRKMISWKNHICTPGYPY